MDLSSQNATLRKAYGLRSRHNYVIENADIHECESFFEPSGEKLVGPAWLADATRMVMRKDYCRSVALERSLHDLSRIHRAPVNRTGEYLLEAKDAVSGTQEKTAEAFVFERPDLIGQIALGIARVGKNIAQGKFSFENRGCNLYYVL